MHVSQMLNRIINFSVNNKLIIGLLTLFLVAYGSYQLTKLPIDAVPDITNNQVQVITVSPSLGAPDVERLITFPLEQALSNIPGRIEIRSFSRFGLSLVTVVFNDETDVYWARQQVSERLQSVKSMIPEGVGNPEMGPVTTGLGEIYQYVLRPKPGYENKYDARQLRTLQDWIVRRQLLGVKGVADVSSFGGYLKQYVVEVDPNRLKAAGVTIAQVFEALQRNNQNEGGAYIEKGPQVLFIRSEGLVHDVKDIEGIVVRVLPDGTPQFIRDIGKVTLGHATRYGAMVYNGEREVAGAVVMMLKGANSNEVITAVKERISRIQASLPEGVVIDAFLDRTKMVNNAIHTVQNNLMEGALIVIFVLVMFLGNMRAGLLVASVIPLALLFAVSMMNAFGVSGNLMSLGALDFGLIVDGAVIIVEAVMHTITHSRRFSKVLDLSQHKMDNEVSHAAGKMMNSAVFGQLIIIVVYLPIFTLQGIEGKMFKPLAETVAFALMGAFLLSLTYIPMMSALLLKGVSHELNFADRWVGRVEHFYHRALRVVLNNPKKLLSGVIALFAFSVFLLMRLGGEFIPSIEEGDFAVETRVITGSNMKVSIDVASKASNILRSEFPEVEEVVSKIGSGEIPTDPMPMEAQDLMIILKPRKEWTSAKTFPELAEKMSQSLSAIPGATFGFQYPVQMRFNELMTGARQDVVVKIFGEDLDTLATYANKMGSLVSGIEGAKDLYVEQVTGMPQIVVTYDRDRLAQYHLSVEEVNQVVHMAFAGKEAGLVYEGERRFALTVRLAGDQRSQLDDIRNLLVNIHDGGQVPLSQLAEVDIIDGPNQIQREDARRRIIVGFNVRGRDVQSIVMELQQKMKDQVKLPVGYSVTYGGAFENLEAAKSRLAVAVPVSLLLIFLLLYFAFGNMRQGLLIYSAIPLSAIGGILALTIRGIPFSISAGIGFIALFGVAVLNGIVLIAEFNRQRQSGITDLKEVVLAGTKLRLRPVLMTACVESLGFLPVAFSNGAGADVQRPLATVVIGGLLVAAFLTLFVLPTLYTLFEGRSKDHHVSPVKAGMILMLLLPGLNAFAQRQVSLPAAIDTAMHRNGTLQAEEYRLKAAQRMRSEAYNLPGTDVQIARGQINSAYNDQQIQVSQAFSLPQVYLLQRRVLQAEMETQQQEVRLKRVDLRSEVTRHFVTYLYLKEREAMLREHDRRVQDQLKLAKLRLDAGESNIIEHASASQQRSESMKQLIQVQHELQRCLVLFNVLMGADSMYVPDGKLERLPASFDPAGDGSSSPYVLKLEKMQQVSQYQHRLDRSRLLPEFKAGFQSMSITGFGSDEKFYPRSTQFTALQLGVAVPIFAGATIGKTRASHFQHMASTLEYQYQKNKVRRELTVWREQLSSADSLCRFFESDALPQSGVALNAALQQFNKGDLNFLEWTMLHRQILQTRLDYLEAIQQYNQILIYIQSYQP